MYQKRKLVIRYVEMPSNTNAIKEMLRPYCLFDCNESMLNCRMPIRSET